MSEPRGTAFTLPLGIQDIMRAEPVPAAAFGGLWNASAQEKKVVAPQSKIGAASAPLAEALHSLLHFHIVSSTATDVTGAAILAGTDKLLLVHCVPGLSLSITVRSNDTFLSDIALKACRALLV